MLIQAYRCYHITNYDGKIYHV